MRPCFVKADGIPFEPGMRFIEVVTRCSLVGNLSDVGLHTLSLDNKPVDLLGDHEAKAFGGKLFVREAGVQLRQFILDQQAAAGQSRFVVSGTPGIGKSSFAVYFAAILLRAGEPVLYQLRNELGILLEPSMVPDQPPRATCFVLPSTNMEWAKLLLASRCGWYIVDSIRPLGCPLPTLLVTSTQPTMYKEWLKQAHNVPYYMPLPTYQEIVMLRDALQLTMSDDELNRHYNLVGASFRLVLSRKFTYLQMERAQRAVYGLITTSVFQLEMEGPQSDKLLSSMLVHIDVERLGDGTWCFDEPFYDFASPAVRIAVAKRAWRANLPQKWLSLQSEIGWDGYAKMRASLFEDLGLRLLTLREADVAITAWDANGLPQQAQRVPSPFAGRRLEPFPGDALPARQIAAAKDAVFRPLQENFAVLDGVGWLGNSTACALQFTISNDRRNLTSKSKRKVLAAAIDLAKEQNGAGQASGRLLYVLVVPHGTAASFKRDNIVFPKDLEGSIEVQIWELYGFNDISHLQFAYVIANGVAPKVLIGMRRFRRGSSRGIRVVLVCGRAV